MTASALCRWHRAWISGASMACLGASSILQSGCAPFSGDLSSAASQSKQQQAASAKSEATNRQLAQKPAQKPGQNPQQKSYADARAKISQTQSRKPVPQVAKSTAGRVRITDGNSEPGSQVVAISQPENAVSPQRPAAADLESKAPTSSTRHSENELAAQWVESLEPAADGKRATKPTVKTVAGTKRSAKKPAAPLDDPFLAQSNAVLSSKREPLSNETLPDDMPVTPSDIPRPPKPDNKQRTAPKPSAVAERSAPPKNEADRSPRRSSHERQRANVLMERAYAMYRSGYPEEALRLASVAAELEKSQQAMYRKGEERPSDFIAWLQSANGGRSASPPVIRPQRGGDGQSADILSRKDNPSDTTTAVATQTKRPLGEILRTEGDSILQPLDPSSQRSAQARSNSGMELLSSETPRFSGSDNSDQRATANSPQIAAALPPATRNPDAAMASSDGPRFDSLSSQDAAPPPPAEAPRKESMSGPSLASSEPPVGKPAAGPVNEARPAETESFPDSESPAVSPARTTQLTLIGVIGLLTGVAGMAGLSWWHVQERRHYSGKS